MLGRADSIRDPSITYFSFRTEPSQADLKSSILRWINCKVNGWNKEHTRTHLPKELTLHRKTLKISQRAGEMGQWVKMLDLNLPIQVWHAGPICGRGEPAPVSGSLTLGAVACVPPPRKKWKTCTLCLNILIKANIKYVRLETTQS